MPKWFMKYLKCIVWFNIVIVILLVVTLLIGIKARCIFSFIVSEIILIIILVEAGLLYLIFVGYSIVELFNDLKYFLNPTDFKGIIRFYRIKKTDILSEYKVSDKEISYKISELSKLDFRELYTRLAIQQTKLKSALMYKFILPIATASGLVAILNYLIQGSAYSKSSSLINRIKEYAINNKLIGPLFTAESIKYFFVFIPIVFVIVISLVAYIDFKEDTFILEIIKGSIETKKQNNSKK